MINEDLIKYVPLILSRKEEEMNILENIAISKGTTSRNILNDAINDRDAPIYKILLQLSARFRVDDSPKSGQNPQTMII